MGTFSVKVTVANPVERARSATLDCLVDTGAAYSIFPRELLGRLGIQPLEQEIFILADGREVSRGVGEARVQINGHARTSIVIFGEAGDRLVLGAHALESLGLQADTVNQMLRPAPRFLLVETPVAARPAPAKRPKPVAWIDPHGCSGEPCQVCIAFCPVDCIRLVTNDPEFAGPTGYCVVEQEKCIGCNLCAMYCPWDDIVMVQPPAAGAPVAKAG